MATCSLDVKAVVCFFHRFQLCLWQRTVVERIIYPVIHSSIHCEHYMLQISSLYSIHFISYIHFSKHLLLIFSILTIQNYLSVTATL